MRGSISLTRLNTTFPTTFILSNKFISPILSHLSYLRHRFTLSSANKTIISLYL